MSLPKALRDQFSELFKQLIECPKESTTINGTQVDYQLLIAWSAYVVVRLPPQGEENPKNHRPGKLSQWRNLIVRNTAILIVKYLNGRSIHGLQGRWCLVAQHENEQQSGWTTQAFQNTKVLERRFIEYDYTNSSETAIIEEVQIPFRYRDRYREMQEKKRNLALRTVQERRMLAMLRSRRYSSRTFPPQLRVAIFIKDDFRCKVCLKTREQIEAEGDHLEVDHVVEWEDGGETCYDNGMTVCSTCNKGLHAAKTMVSLMRKFHRRATN